MVSKHFEKSTKHAKVFKDFGCELRRELTASNRVVAACGTRIEKGAKCYYLQQNLKVVS